MSVENNSEYAVTPRRTQTLQDANGHINGDRDQNYGDATESFTRIAALWSTTLGVDIKPYQVALCLAQLKISRLVASPTHEDSWVDLAGYTALGSEVAEKTIGGQA